MDWFDEALRLSIRAHFAWEHKMFSQAKSLSERADFAWLQFTQED